MTKRITTTVTLDHDEIALIKAAVERRRDEVGKSLDSALNARRQVRAEYGWTPPGTGPDPVLTKEQRNTLIGMDVEVEFYRRKHIALAGLVGTLVEARDRVITKSRKERV